MKEPFTRKTTDNKAHLSNLLTLEKCLAFERDMLDFQQKFERDMLDFQQKYNVEAHYTNYVDSDLKYEIIPRFGLTNSVDSPYDQVRVLEYAQGSCSFLATT